MNKINKDVSKSEVKATKQVNDVQKEFYREVKFWKKEFGEERKQNTSWG